MGIINRLNKMVKCIFMDGITTKNAAKAFNIQNWNNHGIFNFIFFYRGRTFVNYFWAQLITSFGIKQTFPRLITQIPMGKRKI